MPSVTKASPSLHTPVPKAAAALSPAPPATIVPSLRPVSSAISLVIVPAIASESTSGGNKLLSIDNLSKISCDH